MKAQGLVLPVVAADMGSAVTSAPVDIRYVDNVAIQFNFTGSPSGDFFIDASLDQANWTPFTLNPAPAAAGAPGSILVNLADVATPFLRFRYVPSGGGGTLDVWVNMKSLGT